MNIHILIGLICIFLVLCFCPQDQSSFPSSQLGIFTFIAIGNLNSVDTAGLNFNNEFMK